VGNIHKFIAYVVYNWKDSLNEAYAPKVKKQFFDKFKEEADDLNITISDDDLNTYIDRFDQIKNSPKITEKDLSKYTLSQLIKLVTTSKGAEAPEAIDITPDIVYRNEDNTIAIYNGSKEELCTRHQGSVPWCITRGSYGNYRYSAERGFPTFYLAQNTNLPSTDALSFVAIQVRQNGRYVYTNRKNSPYESSEMSFNQLLNEIPWLRDIPNIEGILRYIPLSTGEKMTQQYKSRSISYREWSKLPYKAKEQYLVVRQGKSDLFNDITIEDFVSKHLSQYPQLANFVALNSGLIPDNILLRNLDKFSNQDVKSILANMRGKVSISKLASEEYPFDVKKLLVYTNKWDLIDSQRIYVTKDKNAIVLLQLGNDVKVGVYTKDDDYPNVKLNKRTAKYLLDYPELDKIPLKNLLKLASSEAIDKSVVDNVLAQAAEDPDSAIIIKDIEGGQLIIDSNDFSAYTIKNNTISSVPFESEEVQQVFSSELDNAGIQDSILRLISSGQSMPDALEKETVFSIINSIPYSRRILNNNVVLVAPNTGHPIFTFNSDLQTDFITYQSYGNRRGDWRAWDGNNRLGETEYWQVYFDYLRSQGKTYSDAALEQIFNDSTTLNAKINFVNANPPLNPANVYRPFVVDDNVLLLNTATPSMSKTVGARGNLIRSSVNPATARRLMGTVAAEPEAPEAQAEPTPAAAAAPQEPGVRRRGRPAGGGQPRAQQVVAPVTGDFSSIVDALGPVDLINTWNTLSAAIKNRFAGATRTTRVYGDRGAGRRDNILRGRGRVRQIVEQGNNKLYVIQLQNGTYVASIVLQPGNSHYLLTANVYTGIGSPDNLLATLQAQNLTESEKGLAVKMFLAENPHMLGETTEILHKHLNKK
jgi:hypothetical protein